MRFCYASSLFSNVYIYFLEVLSRLFLRFLRFSKLDIKDLKKTIRKIARMDFITSLLVWMTSYQYWIGRNSPAIFGTIPRLFHFHLIKTNINV